MKVEIEIRAKVWRTIASRFVFLLKGYKRDGRTWGMFGQLWAIRGKIGVKEGEEETKIGLSGVNFFHKSFLRA